MACSFWLILIDKLHFMKTGKMLYDILLFETASAMPMVGYYDLNSEIRIQRGQ